MVFCFECSLGWIERSELGFGGVYIEGWMTRDFVEGRVVLRLTGWLDLLGNGSHVQRFSLSLFLGGIWESLIRGRNRVMIFFLVS